MTGIGRLNQIYMSCHDSIPSVPWLSFQHTPHGDPEPQWETTAIHRDTVSA